MKRSEPGLHSYKALAKMVIRSLKDLSAAGENLNAASLTRALADQPGLAPLLAGASRTGASEVEAQRLKARQEQLIRQKEALMRQIGELEDEGSQKEDLFKRAILTLTNLGGNDRRLAKTLGQLKNQLIAADDSAVLEATLAEIKNLIMRSEGGEETTQGKSLLNRLLKPESSRDQLKRLTEETTERLRQGYLSILNELEVDLGPDYMRRLQSVRQLINESKELDHMLSLRSKLEELIREFAAYVLGERRRAAEFMAEVATNLSEVEGRLGSSKDQALDWSQANHQFHTDMTSQVGQMSAAAQKVRDLESLRDLVIERMTAFKAKLELKERTDQDRLDQMLRELDDLTGKFKTVQGKVAKIKAQNAELARRASTDALTGAANRQAFDERMGQEMDRFQRSGNAFSLIMIDLDHFKKINDAYGHTVGDGCLKEVIRRLKPMVRKVDLLARYGGEEFAVVLPDTNKNQAALAAEKLRQVVESTEFTYRGSVVKVTISLGAAQVEPGDAEPNQLIERADAALYQAKTTGRNRVEIG